MHAALNRWLHSPDEGIRLVGYGSSNTEETWHNLGRWSWFSWLAACLRAQVGRHLSTVNSGISGETTTDLLGRFDRDVAPLRPSLVLVTIGGNDQQRLPLSTFIANLEHLIERTRAIGSGVALQTYYCPTFVGADLDRFSQFMDAMVSVGERTKATVIHQFPGFRAWYDADPDAYREIMLDPMHLNPLGHALFGIHAARGFGLADPPLPPDSAAAIREGLAALSRALASTPR